MQLITAGIAFLLGVFLTRIRLTWAYFTARHFWRPLLKRDLRLVLGDGFPDLQGFEASDVVGRGDLVGSYELTTHFSNLWFRRLQPIFADRIVGDDLTGRPLRRNLIILGGPDANRVTYECVKSLNLRYQLRWPNSEGSSEGGAKELWKVPTLEATPLADRRDKTLFQPSVEDGTITTDYGVIIRAHNPFDLRGPKRFAMPRRRVVILYGCYGYGTLAAVLYSQTREFQERVKNSTDDIECVVKCRVVMGTPQAIDCVYFRSHAHGSLSLGLEDQPNDEIASDHTAAKHLGTALTVPESRGGQSESRASN